MLPYIDRAEQRVRRAGYWLLAASALIGISLFLLADLDRQSPAHLRPGRREGRRPNPTGGGRQFRNSPGPWP